jgi:hypothetical protein
VSRGQQRHKEYYQFASQCEQVSQLQGITLRFPLLQSLPILYLRSRCKRLPKFCPFPGTAPLLNVHHTPDPRLYPIVVQNTANTDHDGRPQLQIQRLNDLLRLLGRC